MVKQPEREEIAQSTETMAIELGIVKQSQADQFIKTSVNEKLRLNQMIGQV